MLYDPKWETKTKPDVFSLDSLIAWLEKQPAHQTYSYIDSRRCLLCQYFSEALGEPVTVTAEGFRRSSSEQCQRIPYPDSFWSVALDAEHAKHRLPVWTFGAALERARAAHSAL